MLENEYSLVCCENYKCVLLKNTVFYIKHTRYTLFKLKSMYFHIVFLNPDISKHTIQCKHITHNLGRR